jgi:hypothetical protein
MSSPISGFVAGIFLQYCEHLLVKYMLFEGNDIIFYHRCVKDIFIISDGHKISAEEIQNCTNHVLKHFDFKLTCEENGKIVFLSVSH